MKSKGRFTLMIKAFLADLRSKSAYSIVICNPHLAQLRVVPRSQWSEGSLKL